MPKLVELSHVQHKDLRVADNCAILLAKKQHAINLRVHEVCNASSNFPIFFTRVENADEWAISAITSYEQGKNLFVYEDSWDASYLPINLQSYPFFLMRKADDEKQFTVGIDEHNEVFSKNLGEPLFDDKGAASLFLSRATAILKGDVENIVHSYQFIAKILQLDLMKAMDVLLRFEDGQVSSITGLQTIDEQKLQGLDVEVLDELRQSGYLAPVYAMLFSLYQLNSLIRRHNLVAGSRKISQIKMEVAKDKF